MVKRTRAEITRARRWLEAHSPDEGDGLSDEQVIQLYVKHLRDLVGNDTREGRFLDDV